MRPQTYYTARPEDGAAINGRIRKVAAALDRHASARATFLDVGCGAGVATRFLADALGVAQPTGVDISQNVVADAARAGVDAVTVDLENERLPFADGSIDVVHCGEVLEHLVDTDHLMGELRRVVSPAGVVALSTPNLAAWHNRLALMLGYQPFLSQVSFRHAPGRMPFVGGEGGGHLRMFTHRALRGFAVQSGFAIVAEYGVGIFELGAPPGSKLLQTIAVPIDAVMSRLPALATDVLIVLRRSES